MSFRPTCLQALGRGGYLGGLVGAGAFVVLAVLAATGVTDWPGGPRRLVLFLPLAPLLVGVSVGGLMGLLLCREEGADIDDAGIRCVPGRNGGYTAWHQVEDLRPERRGGRTRVAVYVESGQTGWLGAPYHGRLLAADPEFERKLFMLRNVLATHRSFALTHEQTPADGN